MLTLSLTCEVFFLLSRILLPLDKASMSEGGLNVELRVIDELNIYVGKPERFPIPKELLTLARLGLSKYQDYVES